MRTGEHAARKRDATRRLQVFRLSKQVGQPFGIEKQLSNRVDLELRTPHQVGASFVPGEVELRRLRTLTPGQEDG